MNILHLKYAVEVARTGSLNKAAESLYMNQPNLSRAIRELEASLGVTLFRRTKRGMLVTPEGEEFLRYAEKILQQIDQVEALYRSGAAVKQRFSISVPHACYISEAFTRFSGELGKGLAELLYMETNSQQAIKNILESDYQLGVIRYAGKHDRYYKEMLEEKGLSYELVTEFHYRLLMSGEHPLAGRAEIFRRDLIPFTEIVCAAPSLPALPVEALRKEERSEEAEKRVFVFDRASAFDLLAGNHNAFLWASPVPEKLRERYGLVQKPCEDHREEYRDVLVYRKDHRLSELEKQFITELCNSKRQCL